MGIELDTQTLRGSARMLADAESSVRGHHPGQHLPAVAGALPGSAAGQAAGALESGWREAYDAWHTTAADHERALQEAADTHAAADQSAGRALGGMIPR